MHRKRKEGRMEGDKKRSSGIEKREEVRTERETRSENHSKTRV